MKIIRQQRLNTQLGNINKTQPLRYTQRFKLIAFSVYLFIPREKIMGEVFLNVITVKKCYVQQTHNHHARYSPTVPDSLLKAIFILFFFRFSKHSNKSFDGICRGICDISRRNLCYDIFISRQLHEN